MAWGGQDMTIPDIDTALHASVLERRHGRAEIEVLV
jgi:hypothetical protein